MNTVALARLLGRHLRVEDPTALPDDAALDVVAAINSGLADFYRLAPEHFRRTTFSATLRAPETTAIEFSAQYSNDVVSPTFAARQFGCTLRVTGYPMDTRISGTSTVLDDFLGTSLTGSARIFGDAFVINGQIERITSELQVRGVTVREWKALKPLPLPTDELQTGIPDRYQIEPFGICQGGDTAALVRVHPLPSTDMIVRFEALLSGARKVTFAMLLDAEDLPVADAHAETILAPLCEVHLVNSPFWAGARAATEDAAAAAMRSLGLLPRNLGSTHHHVGTRRGF